MYTFAPFCASADAIIVPSPEPPPVTRAAEITNTGQHSRRSKLYSIYITRTNLAIDIEQRGYR